MTNFLKRCTAVVICVGLCVVGAVATGQEGLPLEGRVIILDPGHGTGMNTYKGYDEGVQMLAFAQVLQPKLEELGATVYLTRTDEEDVPLAERVTFTNKLSLEILKETKNNQLNLSTAEEKEELEEKLVEIDRLIGVMDSILEDIELAKTYYRLPYNNSEDRVIHEDMMQIFELQKDDDIESRMLYLSLHSNATETPIDESRNGITAYYVTNDYEYNETYYNDYAYEENKVFFSQSITDTVGDVGFEKIPEEVCNFFVNREMNIPSVLIENGFHTNDGDRTLLLAEGTLDLMAEAYCDTIIAYFSCDFIPPIPDYTKETIGSFKDVYQEEWYSEYITYAVEQGLFNGTSEERFDPDGGMTRGMLVTVVERLGRLFGDETVATSEAILPYEDVTENDWFYDAVVYGQVNQYLQQVFVEEENVFGGNQAITREETAQILYQFVKDRDMTAVVTSDETLFVDHQEIGTPYIEAVYALRDLGILSGNEDGTFCPQDTLTRAQVCSLIYHLCQSLVE